MIHLLETNPPGLSDMELNGQQEVRVPGSDSSGSERYVHTHDNIQRGYYVGHEKNINIKRIENKSVDLV